MIRTSSLLFAWVSLLGFVSNSCDSTSTYSSVFVASDTPTAYLYEPVADRDDTLAIADTLIRGRELLVNSGKAFKFNGCDYYSVHPESEGKVFIKCSNVATDKSKTVLETTVWVRTPATLISDTLSSKIAGLADKGSELNVLGYDHLLFDGKVNRYKVAGSKDDTLYIYGKYAVADKDSSLKRYKPDVYDVHHSKVRNTFGGGAATGCDFFPVKKPSFPDNVMPQSCYGLYLTISPSSLKDIDSYIALAETTSINTFVIDFKDNECPGWKAETFAKYSPTNYAHAGSEKERLYRNAVQKLHKAGFYVVGRITCFKDSYFVKDNMDAAISEKATGQPFYHNKAYWPSAFCRKVWQYNVELAKEVVLKFGVNEINFDYVRFPDRMNSVENRIDYHNKYGETKVQAIQRFVTYACDELHALGVYVSIDVFGETANNGYTTPYGQYWPAISNVADVMCGMPYPDHFAPNSYGIRDPWNHPYETLFNWAQNVSRQQAVTTSPAKVRTWVQCYHVMKHVDPRGIDYDATNVEKEIRALFAGGLKDGYLTWYASGNLDRYRFLAPAFRPDYFKESE